MSIISPAATGLDPLATFIGSHGFAARRTPAGTLEALIPWTRQLADGSYDAGANWTDCGTTLRSVRDGLGY
jgi:hypothetical protein